MRGLSRRSAPKPPQCHGPRQGRPHPHPALLCDRHRASRACPTTGRRVCAGGRCHPRYTLQVPLWARTSPHSRNPRHTVCFRDASPHGASSGTTTALAHRGTNPIRASRFARDRNGAFLLLGQCRAGAEQGCRLLPGMGWTKCGCSMRYRKRPQVAPTLGSGLTARPRSAGLWRPEEDLP